MAKIDPLMITIRVRWQLPVYLNTVKFLCQAFDREPNWERVYYWVRKLIVVKVIR